MIDLSLASTFKEFKDAVQYYSALHVKADCLITRNKADYRTDRIPVMTPEKLLALIDEVPQAQRKSCKPATQAGNAH